MWLFTSVFVNIFANCMVLVSCNKKDIIFNKSLFAEQIYIPTMLDNIHVPGNKPEVTSSFVICIFNQSDLPS